MRAVDAAAQRLARDLVVDEPAGVVRWRGPDGTARSTGMHDYAALYAVPGLYEAVYQLALRGRSPRLLAAALARAVPPPGRAAHRVLDVGAGTGGVGAALAEVGFAGIAGTDLEPASAAALLRDRPDVYTRARSMDLLAPTPPDRAWLRAVDPTVVTVAAAVGYGHLPLQALGVLADLLPPGGLLALTVAPELADALAPGLERVVRHEGVHRLRGDGTPLPVLALVLRRPEVP